ncbi:zinc ribbon domain-containing protein [Brasilonema sp. UFV-L1]|uniref:zinc ribbon domain-containing protein n=1 Tax=Brasilonema sp. UFV-L1 TaxID=2234130 RepID=UPI0030DBFACC
MVSKKQQKTEYIYTQVIPVVSCSDETQVNKIMYLCGTPRALSYNKLGSLQGWGLDWKKADPIVRTILKPTDIRLPAKLWEWSVNDAMKTISAQQEAVKTFLIRDIYRKTKDEIERKRLTDLLNINPTGDNWLHRQFRKQYLKGHTFVRNQIVYQGAGYSCKRLTRSSVQLEVAGFVKGKRITLKLRCRHVIKGQIRLIRNDQGSLEVHCIRIKTLVLPQSKPTQKIGIDKGYTEGFYTSEGIKIAEKLGQLMTAKTNRITRTNRNRYRLFAHAQSNPGKGANILKNNLGHKVKSRLLVREKATIQNFIRRDLRRTITTPVDIICEDLTQPIKGKQQAKHINRKLNQWMKGELQASIDLIALETGSTVSVVNPAYTSQVDSLTGTLLGRRSGDRFIRYTGDVIQADLNAAVNIRVRGTDNNITRYMKSGDVESELLTRTVRYLASISSSVTDALNLGWLLPKFKAKALKLETQYHPQG